MDRRLPIAAALLCAVLAGAAAAQSAPAPHQEGTLVLMAGSAELEVANDEAVANFFVEVQDADLARAQSQVNQRIAETTRSLRRADAGAELQTSGYFSQPIYRRDGDRRPVAWRVRHGVTLRTADLDALARAVAAAQPHAALGALEFRLSRAAREKAEAALIRGAIANLNARIAAAAQALGVAPARIRTEELNFGVHAIERPPVVALARAAASIAEGVVEPQFEPGRSLQQMTVTARVRFLRE